MNENKLIETIVFEYRNLFETDGLKADGKFDNDRLALAL